jgi:hypothetical protein
MKKFLLFFASLLSAGAIIAQTDCSDLFMSEYVEGWNNNKSLELYNPTGAPITLDNIYRLIRWSNGAINSDEDMQYVLPLVGTIDSYKVMVMIQDTVPDGQDTMVWPALRKKATWLAPFAYNTVPPTQGGNVVFWNGDDAISLQKKINDQWVDIDIFGEIGVKPKAGGTGTLGAWTDTKPYWTGVGKYLTMNKTLVRKHTIKHGVDRQTMIHYGDSMTGNDANSFYALLEYDSLPSNTFDSLGNHWCDCKNAQSLGSMNKHINLVVNPNPVSGGQFTVRSTLPFISIEVVSMIGRSVYSQNFARPQRDARVMLNNLPVGVYFVKVLYGDNQSGIKKIVLQ